MATLRACSRCGSHVRIDGSPCPFCGSVSARPALGLGTVAVLMGLALAGCEKKGSGPTPPVEPEYGVPVSDTAPPDDGGAMPDDSGGEPDEGQNVEPLYGEADPPRRQSRWKRRKWKSA